MTGQSHDGALPLPALLGSLTAELTDLSGLASQLEEAIGRLIDAGVSLPVEALEVLQSADMLSQSLSGLARFGQVLASETQGVELPAAAVDRACAALTLGRQRSRLGGDIDDAGRKDLIELF